MSLKPTDRVRILVEPYAGFCGEIAEMRTSPERVIVVVGVLGKTTSVEVLPSQIEPADSSGDDDSSAPVRSPSRPRPGGLAGVRAESDIA